jgi:hypothetical protein
MHAGLISSSYIALTNQTTYEVARRRRISYFRWEIRASPFYVCDVLCIFFLEIMAVVKCVFVQLAEESQKEFIHSVKASVEISMISAPLVRRGLF